MDMNSLRWEEKSYRALAVQLIEVDTGAVVRRGATQLRVEGALAAHYVASLLGSIAGAPSAKAVVDSYPAPHRAAVSELLEQLIGHRFVVPVDGELPAADETQEDVFYWQLGGDRARAARRLADRRFTVVGVNRIGIEVAAGLVAAGAGEVVVVDYPLLRNSSYADAEGALLADKLPPAMPPPIAADKWSEADAELDVIVAAADFGGLQAMRAWNELAVASRCEFFPIVLQDMVGYVGPLVVPGETACFECFRARQNAVSADPVASRLWESFAHDGQHVSPVHPVLAALTANVALFELLKFYGGGLGIPQAGTVVDVRLTEGTMRTRRVLKIPRCSVCGGLNRRVARAIEFESALTAEAAE